MLAAAMLSTIYGIANAVHVSGKPSKLTAKDIIDKNRKYVTA